jgi:serine/threonine protein kinase
MDHARADRNLLYGVMALQLGFVGRDDLIEAMVAWVADKSRPLGRVLIERGALDPADDPPIAQVVERLLQKHGNDPARSLASLEATLADPITQRLLAIDDAELHASLAVLDSRIKPDPGATTIWTEDSRVSAVPSGNGAPARPGGPRFTVLRPHAKGGLGVVQVARDEELGREVALKQMRPEHARNERLRMRFVREAEINGGLEHPGIVPVYGLGLDAEGRPYYAMRFVQGQTLQQALEAFHAEASSKDRLGYGRELRGLLRRFLDVCEAIAYAHSRGVLHRDLKPANVLLGPFGETLIIDWGLSKYLGDREDLGASGGSISREVSGDATLSTVAGETLGSPPYMSPEQARGEHDDLGPACDVYGLGAILYAVLTGRPPVKGSSTSEVLERVRRGAIEPPGAVNPRLPKPLEAICLKAMRLDPSDRYETARALADDLEHWLDDQPVAAYRDPLATRLLRWSRRHRPLVAASLALLLATAVGLGIATVVVGHQRAKAEQARDQAIAARMLARDHLRVGLDVVDQLVTFGDRQLVAQMSPEDRNRFLGSALEFISQFRRREPGDPEIGLQTAQIARRLANLYRLTGRYDLADRFYTEALATIESLRARQPGVTEYGALLAETLLDQGGAQLLSGHAPEAEATTRRSLELTRAHLKAEPARARFQRADGRTLTQLATVHLALGRDDVPDLASEAADTLKRLADDALPTVREDVLGGRVLPLLDQLEWVQALITLAEGLDRAGRDPEAESALRLARDRMVTLADRFADKDVVDVDAARGWVDLRLARQLAGGDASDEPLVLAGDASERLRQVERSQPGVPQFRAALAEALVAHADLLARAEQLDLALTEAREAEDRLRALADEHRQVPDYKHLLAEALDVHARIARRLGPDHDAEARGAAAEAVRQEQAARVLNPDEPTYRERLDAYRARLAEIDPE